MKTNLQMFGGRGGGSGLGSGGGNDERAGQRFPFIIPSSGSYDWRSGNSSSERQWATIVNTPTDGGKYIATFEDRGTDYDVYKVSRGQHGYEAVRKKRR